MAFAVPRLRRWIAFAAVLAIATVGGFYAYARWRVTIALHTLPAKLEKLGVEVKETAEDFTISKSEGGRTLFSIHGSKLFEYKGGRAQLHNVTVTVYGKDASRYDQISGADFEYDKDSGNISARGPVTIDLVANPKGLLHADQAPPEDLKDPLHIRTSGLVFNQKTGNAYTHDKVEFSIAAASGGANGATYDSKSGVLVLERDIRITTTGPSAADLTARHGRITKEPLRVYLDHTHLVHAAQQIDAQNVTLFLSGDNTIERILGEGGVHVQAHGATSLELNSERAELFLAGKNNQLRQAIVSGNVVVTTTGGQNTQATAGRVVFDFAGNTLLTKAHAQDGVRLIQKPSTPAADSAGVKTTSAAQQVEIAADAMDFFTEGGRHLSRAETLGAGQITLAPPNGQVGQVTRVNAGQFIAQFDAKNRMQTLHGAPQATITTITPGQTDRVSSSSTLDVAFKPQGGIDSILQQGDVHYRDSDRQAFAAQARFTLADKMIVLTGSPRVTGQGLTTTAQTLRLNRESGEAVAEGNVKSTYSELKPQPGGALLASSDPIHVTAARMTAKRESGTAFYSGAARLWQGPNIVSAATITFDREHRSMLAEGGAGAVSTSGAKQSTGGTSQALGRPSQPVTTVLVQTGADHKTTLVTITSTRLTYVDADRRIHFEGGVTMQGSDATITSRELDVTLAKFGPAVSTQTSSNQAVGTPSRLERAVASGNVVIQQQTRKATGESLVYEVSEDKFTLTGGKPSIFDAERGKITGDSLTFFRRDDRVVVEGKANSPVITHTRMAR